MVGLAFYRPRTKFLMVRFENKRWITGYFDPDGILSKVRRIALCMNGFYLLYTLPAKFLVRAENYKKI